jgi:hypothetical protein
MVKANATVDAARTSAAGVAAAGANAIAGGAAALGAARARPPTPRACPRTTKLNRYCVIS